MAKQKKNKKKKRKEIPNRSLSKLKYSTMKMSAIIWEFAGDYILLGEKLEHKQNLLNSASSAWNIGNLHPDRRKEALEEYLDSFRTMNPDIDMIDDLREDMERLIQEKARHFSKINRQIFNAEIYEEDGRFRITVASAYIPDENI